MGAVSRLLRNLENDGLAFWCPGCNEPHRIQHGVGNGPRWQWNGDVDKPTFSPSILVTNGHYLSGWNGDSCWCTYNKEHPDDKKKFKCTCCHSFITDGNIQFLNDCSHELAGKTVPLPTFKSEDNEVMENK